MTPIRLCSVLGYEGRLNDVLFHPPIVSADEPTTVVFFGGDIQDLPEIMESHKENRNYLKWNLVNVANLLSHNFPKSSIIVVRPSRIEFKSFSCYDNFVPSNNAGVPDHTPTHYSLQHLERLLQSVAHMLKTMPTTELLENLVYHQDVDIDIDVLQDNDLNPDPGQEDANDARSSESLQSVIKNHQDNQIQDFACNKASPEERLWWRDKLSLDRCPLTLIGFSKGCVVLNQFVYEFHYLKTLTPGDEALSRFVNRVRDIYWLDGGHAGAKNTWITSRSLLETLARLDVNIYVHVSPYQVQDDRRPWIGREERAFMKLLKKLDAKVWRYFHQPSSLGQSLHTHFEVLATFKHMQDTTPTTAIESSDEDS